MKTILILSTMLMTGIAQAAPARSGELDGGKYRVELKGEKNERDTLVFEKGMMHSIACDPYGFAPAPYKASKKGDAIEVEGTIVSRTEGNIEWKGSVRGGKISGRALWKKQGQKTIEYTFDGQIDRAAQAAASARSDIEKTFGFVPTFMRQVSDHVLPGAWEEMKTLQMNPNTALSGKVKELIGLAVASQIPCTYCTQAHTDFARFMGASEEELGEAIGMAGLARHWSTVLNGSQIDPAAFSKEIARMVEIAKKGGAEKPELEVVDAKSARADMERAIGFVPSFTAAFPEAALAGAWRELRDLEMSNGTALGMKEKSLIGLAVSAQIPCRYCIEADTAFAKLAGASDREIQEAVAMAALTRNMSTLLNGHQVDREQFRREIERILAGIKSKRQS